MRLLSLVLSLTVAASLLSGVAHSEQLSMPEQATTTDRPSRGMSMNKVEATFGTPTKRDPAVGQPPITRWEYPGFVVYFEHQFVIHAVAVS